MNKMRKADMVFWREAVVYYRNLRKAYRIAGNQEKAEEARVTLKESRLWQRFIEKAVFRAAILLVVVALNGCQTLKGAMGDSAWLIQKGADNITTEK